MLEGKVKKGVYGHLDRNIQLSVVVPDTLNTLPPSHCSCSVTEEILQISLLCVVLQFMVFLILSALYYPIPVYKSFKCAH